MGLNRELNNDMKSAFQYHKKAFEEWKKCNEITFVLISLHHILYLADQIGIDKEQIEEYEEFYSQLLQSEQFKNTNPDILFKDFEIKISVAKNVIIFNCLKNYHFFISYACFR